MNEFKGTKGKWIITNNTVKVNECSKLFMTISSGVVSNSIVGVSYSRHNLEYEVKANALLISKAPEMLEMLKKQSDFLVYCRDNMKVSRPVFNAKIMEIEQLIKEATTI